MKTPLTAVLVLAAGLGSAHAQTAPNPAAPQAPAALAMDAMLKGQYASVKRLLTLLADAMPADQYAFKPTPDVRTFAAGVAHTAATNFGMCANLTGKPNPQKGAALEQTTVTKADAMKILADSFAFCDEFVNRLSPESLQETYAGAIVAKGGQRSAAEFSRGGLFSNLIAHGNEMYGYLSVYLRLKGLVPPSSQPPAGRGRGGAGGW